MRSADRWAGQQDVEGGQQVLCGDPSTLSTHTEVEFLLLFLLLFL